MSKMLISFAALAALTVAAQAQTTAPDAQPAAGNAAKSAGGEAQTKAPDAQPAAGDAAKPAGGDTANQQTYKMKDGSMYEPPAERPASPAMDTKTYGRT